MGFSRTFGFEDLFEAFRGKGRAIVIGARSRGRCHRHAGEGQFRRRARRVFEPGGMVMCLQVVELFKQLAARELGLGEEDY